RLLDASGALYLDTQESRGLVPADHPSFAGAVRAAAMTDADLVLVIGRRLDYQLGYGSPAVFPHARFVRIAGTAGEPVDNRPGGALSHAPRGRREPLAAPAPALSAIAAAAGTRRSNAEAAWAEGLRRRQRERTAKGRPSGPASGADGKIHPARIFDAIAAVAD